jgi:hypothetical protein
MRHRTVPVPPTDIIESPPAAAEADPLSFLSHVRQHAHDYFPEFGSEAVNVEVMAIRERSRSSMYVYSLSTAALQRKILVKVIYPVRRAEPTLEEGGFLLGARPYLSNASDPAELPTLQFRGLALMHDHVSKLGDPRFGSIRPLDCLPEHRAIIMEYVAQPTLREAMRTGIRVPIARAPRDLTPAFRNAGAWLREYHDLDYARTRPPRRATISDLTQAIADYTRYLASATGDAPFFRLVADRVERRAAEVSLPALPLGLSHGDFLARNVFVGAHDRVAAFDALPRWRVPIYEDLARFVMGIRSVGLQVISLGMAYKRLRLNQYEASVLEGYFPGGSSPIRTIQLYEMLILLDKWAALLARSRPTGIRYRIAMAVRVRLFHQYFRREAERLLRDMGANGR